ncbi:UNVERIFIED_CONTAM: AUGMIN subunit [Sesamum radiatum]|uniref:AUGMIN subunit n=1 Tax=Sesamum radiatum TaxID=300843 RepID=A0AAW2JY81_SESRA
MIQTEFWQLLQEQKLGKHKHLLQEKELQQHLNVQQCKERQHYLEALVYEALEHQMVVAEAAQKLRLPLISKDGEIHEEEIEKWSLVSRSSLDSTSTSVTISSSTNSIYYTNVSAIRAGASANNPFAIGVTDASVPEVGGVPNRFLGITPAYLWQTQLQQAPPIVLDRS